MKCYMLTRDITLWEFNFVNGRLMHEHSGGSDPSLFFIVACCAIGYES